MKFLHFIVLLNTLLWQMAEVSMQLPIVINTWPLPNATQQGRRVLVLIVIEYRAFIGV